MDDFNVSTRTTAAFLAGAGTDAHITLGILEYLHEINVANSHCEIHAFSISFSVIAGLTLKLISISFRKTISYFAIAHMYIVSVNCPTVKHLVENGNKTEVISLPTTLFSEHI